MRRRGGAVLTTVVVALVAVGCTSTPDAGPSSPGTGVSSPGSSGTASAAAPAFSMTLTPSDKAADVAPGEPVVVSATGGKLTEVVLKGADGKVVAGQLAADGSTWKSTEGLGFGKTYTAAAAGQGADGKSQVATSTFSTAKPKKQASLSMNPLDGQTVGVGQPLAFYFDAPVTDKAAAEKALGITTAPVTMGAFHWFSDKEVHWRPKEFWAAGTKITIAASVYGKHLGGGVYGKEDRTAAVTVGDSVVMVADGATHQMTVTVNGTVAKTIPISMGKKAHETPVGTYVVMSEHTDYTMDSSTYGVPVDAPQGYRTKVAVASRMSNSGIFYHSAPWSVRDQGARNVSHGCINMSTENAKWLQSISTKGDVITVQNSGGPVLEPTDGLSVWQIPWAQWQAGGKK